MVHVGTIWIDYGLSRSEEEIREVIAGAVTMDMQAHGDLLRHIATEARATRMGEAEYPIARWNDPANEHGAAFHWTRHRFPSKEDPVFEYDLGRRFGFDTIAWHAHYTEHAEFKYIRREWTLQ